MLEIMRNYYCNEFETKLGMGMDEELVFSNKAKKLIDQFDDL